MVAIASFAAACAFGWPVRPSSPAKLDALVFPATLNPRIPQLCPSSMHRCTRTAMAKNSGTSSSGNNQRQPEEQEVAVEEEEEEEELPWIQEKALELVEFTGSVTQAIPGPRVGRSSVPWILAIPLVYAGVSFVVAFVKTVRKFNSPKEKRRKLLSYASHMTFYLRTM